MLGPFKWWEHLLMWGWIVILFIVILVSIGFFIGKMIK